MKTNSTAVIKLVDHALRLPHAAPTSTMVRFGKRAASSFIAASFPGATRKR